ncbi:nitrate ABC transporter transmembrane protein [Advenella kashmirensis WT001]|uniref:Nitrate ABC transporter transmembrane protein n=1 Tax=Advenella kashmirensis (strain DSM 17095 / LMG 22695 / WT001) TaxID=1036672 RepID=I3U9H8_ADVKW|nr:nitrate ABC transporter transmembrane protein [Advenella kashmirensis WT001]
MNTATKAVTTQPWTDWPVMAWLTRLGYPLIGLMAVVIVWEMVAGKIAGIPTPLATLMAAVTLFQDPFYRNGPNDVGIGWNVLASLWRVGVGFGLAALVGIPAGFIIGRYAPIRKMTAPVISLLRPVSPLAWLPLGLLMFRPPSRQPSGPSSSAPSGR